MIKKRTILIVDDSLLNRKILSKILSQNEYNVIEAENGLIALNILEKNDKNISLVLLDISMPVMDGFALLDKLSENGLISSIPVIITTGNDENNAEIKSLTMGASDFLTKPYNPDIVIHRIKNIFRLYDNAFLINRLETDSLTGVYNRAAFFRHVEEKLQSNPNDSFEIVCCDIENFKIINAKFGVKNGDSLLKFVAKNNIFITSQDNILGRLGGDNFVLLRKSSPIHSDLEIKELYNTTYSKAPVSNFIIKFGIYPISNKQLSVDTMCNCARIALSSIKYKYGIYYAVYDDSMGKKMERDQLLSEYMEQALVEKQFKVYLQPKHDVKTGLVFGAEALVRWIHPKLGFISPGEFIPLFEQNGFITKLDKYVWEEVCHIIQKWIQEKIEPIPISINISRIDFTASDVPKTINDLVTSHNIPHDIFHLEITESAYSKNQEQIISDVKTLRDMGFLIEMDDFGSGYSSLNMLAELPIDYLKLDMKFIQNKNEIFFNSKLNILSFIIILSKWLQYPTIAEGVESESEVDLLKSMGCNYIQGYFYAKPMNTDDFEIYLMKNRNENKYQKIDKDNYHSTMKDDPKNKKNCSYCRRYRRKQGATKRLT